MSTFRLTRRDALRASLGASGAVALTACATSSGQELTPARFDHGVASGDPTGDRVVIWTRATPHDETAADARIRWVVARDAALRDVVRQGVRRTDATVDFTVKIDVDGLSPGTRYHYGFVSADGASPVGRTQTLPNGAIDRLTIAAVSCSNFPFGYFHAYRHLAQRGDVDLVIALGDYIYEYGGEGSWGQEIGETLGRAHMPARETVSLADYRQRHAQYKSDPDLQAAHAAAPWMCSWDDHEITDNPWMDGAQNHQPDTEGPWATRKGDALRAYFEWMPVREPQAGRTREALWRGADFGGLARVMVFETRLSGRVEQLTYHRDLASLDDADVQAFLERLNDPARMMISAEQETYVVDQVQDAAENGVAWTVFGNQIIFARQRSVNMVEAYPAELLDRLSAGSSWIASAIERSPLGLPINLDAWDGYPVQRDRLSDAFAASGANVVMVTGDTHSFWANELHDTQGRRYGAEFGAAGITSPGFGRSYRGVTPDIHDVIAATNREVRYANSYNQGYLSVTFTPQAAVCEMYAVSDVADPDATVSLLRRWRVDPRVEGAALPSLTDEGAV